NALLHRGGLGRCRTRGVGGGREHHQDRESDSAADGGGAERVGAVARRTAGRGYRALGCAREPRGTHRRLPAGPWRPGVPGKPQGPRPSARSLPDERAKSDPFDAYVLATFLRTDHGHLAPLRPSSEAAQELKGLTRDHARQVRQQTRLLNQLTATLKAYYPRALEGCEDLKSQWARAFLREDSTPAAVAALTARQ